MNTIARALIFVGLGLSCAFASAQLGGLRPSAEAAPPAAQELRTSATLRGRRLEIQLPEGCERARLAIYPDRVEVRWARGASAFALLEGRLSEVASSAALHVERATGYEALRFVAPAVTCAKGVELDVAHVAPR